MGLTIVLAASADVLQLILYTYAIQYLISLGFRAKQAVFSADVLQTLCA